MLTSKFAQNTSQYAPEAFSLSLGVQTIGRYVLGLIINTP